MYGKKIKVIKIFKKLKKKLSNCLALKLKNKPKKTKMSLNTGFVAWRSCWTDEVCFSAIAF